MVGRDPVEAPGAVRTAYAGFWRRALAAVVDGLLLSAVEVASIGAVLALAPNDPEALRNVLLALSLLAWAYFSVLESSPLRATVGKLAAGIWVGDVHGDPISFTRATFRYWFKTLSALSLSLGYLMAAFTPRKQALHDLLAGTLVLRAAPAARDAGQGAIAPAEHWDGSSWVGSGSRLEAP